MARHFHYINSCLLSSSVRDCEQYYIWLAAPSGIICTKLKPIWTFQIFSIKFAVTSSVRKREYWEKYKFAINSIVRFYLLVVKNCNFWWTIFAKQLFNRRCKMLIIRNESFNKLKITWKKKLWSKFGYQRPSSILLDYVSRVQMVQDNWRVLDN